VNAHLQRPNSISISPEISNSAPAFVVLFRYLPEKKSRTVAPVPAVLFIGTEATTVQFIQHGWRRRGK